MKLLILFLSVGLALIISCNPDAGKQLNSNHLESVTSESDLVFEGTVISHTKNYFRSRTIYSSKIVEVNTVFTGELNEKVIEVITPGGRLGNKSMTVSDESISLPSLNTTAIFYLKEIEESDPLYELQSQTAFKLYSPIRPLQITFPSSYLTYQKVNVEEEIYQPLEQRFGTSRKEITLPATYDEIAIEHLMWNDELIPNRRKGLVYELSPLIMTMPKEQIGFKVSVATTNFAGYLNQGALTIEYNTAAFGDSIVASGNLKYQFWDGESDTLNPFLVSYSDIKPNEFLIKWKLKGEEEKGIQLLPSSTKRLLGKLFFNLENKNEKINLEVNGPDSLNLHFDYELNEPVPFEYIATNTKFRQTAVNLFPHVLNDN